MPGVLERALRAQPVHLRPVSARPRLLDLFCGAGGCSVGYARAGFDVTGVDTDRLALKRYPFRAVRMDALDALAGGIRLDRFDAVHASPPCQAYSVTRHAHSVEHPDLLPAVRAALESWGGVWVIENVPGAPLPDAVTLCGSEFGLSAVDIDGRRVWLKRHRLFASNVTLMGAGGCYCRSKSGSIAGVYSGGSADRAHAKHVRKGGYTPAHEVRRALMGVDWMTQNQLSQAIPPDYTEHIGWQLLEHLKSPRALQ